MKFFIYTGMVLFILLCACSDQSYVEHVETSSSTKLREDNAFKDYEAALDKARGVEDAILDAAERQRKEIQEKGY